MPTSLCVTEKTGSLSSSSCSRSEPTKSTGFVLRLALPCRHSTSLLCFTTQQAYPEEFVERTLAQSKVKEASEKVSAGGGGQLDDFYANEGFAADDEVRFLSAADGVSGVPQPLSTGNS